MADRHMLGETPDFITSSKPSPGRALLDRSWTRCCSRKYVLKTQYEPFLKLPRIRFLLADDPGAGKTIMAGLLITELKIRGLIKRILIITPANLTFQWQREMKDKFREHFEVIRGDVLRANYGSNPWQRTSTRSSPRCPGFRGSRMPGRACCAAGGIWSSSTRRTR